MPDECENLEPDEDGGISFFFSYDLVWRVGVLNDSVIVPLFLTKKWAGIINQT